MTNPYLPNPAAKGIARIYDGAEDLALCPEDKSVFPPDDNWTLALAAALTTLHDRGSLDNQRILELGAGSGVNMLGLFAMGHFFEQPPSYIGLDLTCEAVAACERLAECHDFRDDIDLVCSNLLQNIPDFKLEGVSKVIACLPQVVWDYEAQGREPEPREFADYYVLPEQRVPEDEYALGLLARALDEIRERIPKASVVFNVAGRQGDLSEQLFADHGFPHIEKVVSRIIPHDPLTSLTSFAKWEDQSGNACRFFADANAENSISAAEAEERRVAQAPVFHELFVVEASPEK